jgi:hypothetical protein
MTWIRVDCAVTRHPKLVRFANAMGMSRHEGLGVLVDLWTWAVDYTENGDLSKYTSDELMAALNISSANALIEPDVLGALAMAGFIDRDKKTIQLHDWDLHQGQLMAQREANKQRQRRYRERQRSEGTALVDNPDIPSVRVMSRDDNDATERNATNVTKRTSQERPALIVDPSVELLTWDGLEPITQGHMTRWRKLFPDVNMEIELEAMRVYLHGSPASKRPKKTLARFGLNWLKRHAQTQDKDQRSDNRIDRRHEQQAREGAEQVAGHATTKPASPEAIEAARDQMSKMFRGR